MNHKNVDVVLNVLTNMAKDGRLPSDSELKECTH